MTCIIKIMTISIELCKYCLNLMCKHYINCFISRGYRKHFNTLYSLSTHPLVFNIIAVVELICLFIF